MFVCTLDSHLSTWKAQKYYVKVRRSLFLTQRWTAVCAVASNHLQIKCDVFKCCSRSWKVQKKWEWSRAAIIIQKIYWKLYKELVHFVLVGSNSFSHNCECMSSFCNNIISFHQQLTADPTDIIGCVINTVWSLVSKHIVRSTRQLRYLICKSIENCRCFNSELRIRFKVTSN